MTEQKRIGVVIGVSSGTLTTLIDSEIKTLSREINGSKLAMPQQIAMGCVTTIYVDPHNLPENVNPNGSVAIRSRAINRLENSFA